MGSQSNALALALFAVVPVTVETTGPATATNYRAERDSVLNLVPVHVCIIVYQLEILNTYFIFSANLLTH